MLDDSIAARDLTAGELLGWFNMGSTVVLLMPPGAARWDENLIHGSTVVMGERIGSLETS